MEVQRQSPGVGMYPSAVVGSPVGKPSVTPPPTTAIDYEFVLVTYYSRPHIEPLLGLLPPTAPLVVVDNAQDADQISSVVIRRPGTRYIVGPGRGFAAAANIGAASSDADYLVFINPDCRPDASTVKALLDDLRTDPSLGVSAALMTEPGGATEHGVGGWEFTLRRALVHAVGLHALAPRAGLYARPALSEAIDVDWVTMACAAVPRSVFAELGGFDESFFVYCEDVDFGRRLRQVGLHVRLRTDLPVQHGAGSSGAGSLTMQRIKGASFAKYVTRRNGALRSRLIRAALTAGFLGRVLLCLVRGRRELAWAHLAYVRGLVRGADENR